MTDTKTKIAAILSVLAMVAICVSAAPSSDAEGDYTHGDFLLDYGNGSTKWIATKPAPTISGTVSKTLLAVGITSSISGGTITVDGLGTICTGGTSTGGSISTEGMTGVTVTCSWHIYSWNASLKKWTAVDPSDYSSTYSSQKLALGYYPDGGTPTVNPDYKTAWTMIAGDSENSANQTVEDMGTGAKAVWQTHGDGSQMSAYGCYCGTLYVDGMAIVKTGGLLTSYNADTGAVVWQYEYSYTQIEMACPLIACGMVYLPTTLGKIYGFDVHEGPGPGNANVIEADTIPATTVPLEYTASYGAGATALVFHSGCIYAKAHNGMVYCFNKDLELVWAYQMAGQAYYTPATVIDDYVFAGTYDGYLYVLNRETGELIHKELIFQKLNSKNKLIGSCSTAVPIRYGGGYYLFMTYSDGAGMNSNVSSLMLYKFNTGTNELTRLKDFIDEPDFGRTGNLVTRYVSDDFSGIIVACNVGIFKVNTDGTATLLNSLISKTQATHATPVLVNNKVMYVSTYSSQEMFSISTTGETLGIYKFDNEWYAMAVVTVVDGHVIRSDDNGVTAFTGTELNPYNTPVHKEPMPLWQLLLIILIVVIAVVAALWAVLRFGYKWEKPFAELHRRVLVYFFGENYSHNTKSKRKLHAVILVGTAVTIIAAIASLCIGSKTTLGVGEALSAMVSSIGKGGRGLTYEEMLIYNQRLPRALATVAVGIGLSVAGAMYQAVIKNPLVEPYIMGVSSGAGTLAVAVLLANFTFFGLFSAQSPFLIAISAIVGGLLAFGCTMLMAEKTGGKSINYVLAGIVVGLVFSAIQSILMIRSGTKMSNALSWLYGSFASVSWDTVWLILIPCFALSLVPLIWAKELNLVLLGEDQAMQMGLNAKKFDRMILIVASVLTSFCVAFCGIIGFVGLVVPHLARMILGGDHRLMLPVSMAFGGLLMTVADLLARVLVSGYELPVGAVTTMIGVPVFAYLLIRSGGRYDA